MIGTDKFRIRTYQEMCTGHCDNQEMYEWQSLNSENPQSSDKIQFR